jgi:hypothetical protein
VQEFRHRLARAICHGKRGNIVQAYRDGQEDQLAALGLVLNAVVLWTTRYLDAAVAELEAAGHAITDTDKARLSPLKDKHLNCLGRYAFTASQPPVVCAHCGTRRPATTLTPDWLIWGSRDATSGSGASSCAAAVIASATRSVAATRTAIGVIRSAAAHSGPPHVSSCTITSAPFACPAPFTQRAGHAEPIQSKPRREHAVL